MRLRRPARRVPEAEDEPGGHAALAREGPREGVRRLPERRHGQGRGARRTRGFRSVEHLKRYTTLGMATDQGKTSNVNGLAIMAELTGRSIAADRHHDLPAALRAGGDRRDGRGTIAARISARRGSRRASLGAGAGAVFVEAGLWLRAQWFPRAGESDWLESVNREVRTVRERRRRVRRLDARQDRRAGRGRRRVPRPGLHQHLLHAAGRQGALRPDAARGRLRHGRRHDRAARPTSATS